MLEKIESGALEFALHLNYRPSIPRKVVVDIQNIAKRTLFVVIAEIFEPIKTYISTFGT